MSFLSGDDYDDVLSDDAPTIEFGSEIDLQSSEGSQIPVGFVTDLIIRFEDASGNLIAGGIEFSAEADGAVEILSETAFPEQSGYRDITYTGEYILPLRILEGSSAAIRIQAESFSQARFDFFPVNGGSIQLDEIDNAINNDFITYRYEVRVEGDRGQLLNDYNGTARAGVVNNVVASVQNPQVQIREGLGTVTVQLQPFSATRLNVTIPGFPPASVEISDLPDAVADTQLAIRYLPEAIEMNSETVVEVVVVDEAGNERPAPAGTQLQVTEETAHLLTVTPRGDGEYIIRTNHETGVARLVAMQEGLLSDPQTIKVVSAITREDIVDWQPNPIVTSVLGSDFANFSIDDNPIANTILFNGRTQAVLSALNKSVVPYPRASVNRDGGVRIIDTSLEVEISQLDPLRIQIYDRMSGEGIVEYALEYESNPELYQIRRGLNESIENNQEGIYFELMDTSGEMGVDQSGSSMWMTFEDRRAIGIDSDGSLQVYDNRFELQFEQAGELPIISVLYNGFQVVGQFVFVGAKLDPYTMPATDISYFPIQGNTDGSLGFSITGEGVHPLLPNGGKAFEKAYRTFAPGFNEDDNFAMQMAAGSTAGESLLLSAGPSAILLGDPSVRFGQDKSIIGGFDRTTGREIYRHEREKNMASATGDINADGLPDIFLANQRGEVKVLKNHSGLHFRDMGTILSIPGRVKSIVVADFDADDFEDVLVLDDDFTLHLFRNEEQYMRPFQNFTLPNVEVNRVESADFDDAEAKCRWLCRPDHTIDHRRNRRFLGRCHRLYRCQPNKYRLIRHCTRYRGSGDREHARFYPEYRHANARIGSTEYAPSNRS